MSTKAVRVTVSGLVQGVGFRYHTVDAANRLGVLGWVRNEDDGTVSVHAEGESSNVDTFVEWLQRGPRGAQVSAVKTELVEPKGLEQFTVHTASA